MLSTIKPQSIIGIIYLLSNSIRSVSDWPQWPRDKSELFFPPTENFWYFWWDFFLKKKVGHSRPLFIYFRLFNTVDKNKCSIKFCRWLELNRGPLVSNATALPTEPQPLLHDLCWLPHHFRFKWEGWEQITPQMDCFNFMGKMWCFKKYTS